ncbi:MAG: 2Fe-2S iron-sulfur cluster binding domain-containing protein [Gammaproteobacteria bacterium]|nr:2Fe-2S iron-sulfur cluster binding domain-containing protein [Gammaproteobacteria bacterium]
MKLELTVNGRQHSVDVEPEATLLWVLRDELKLSGTKYGCGMAACGACMVHVDGKSVFSCQLQAASAVGKAITTIEGLSKGNSHPLQQAWIEEQVPQCGYCQSGQIMRAAELLATNKQASRKEIMAHMNTNLCRCGTYPRIIRAIESAAERMRDSDV